MIEDPELKRQVQVILDCFSCADGGVALVKFNAALNKWKAEGGGSSQVLLDMVKQFSKLIEITSR